MEAELIRAVHRRAVDKIVALLDKGVNINSEFEELVK